MTSPFYVFVHFTQFLALFNPISLATPQVTGVEQMPGEDRVLVTSNDSRIRVYDLRDLSLSCKFKGYTNNSSQIRASFR